MATSRVVDRKEYERQYYLANRDKYLARSARRNREVIKASKEAKIHSLVVKARHRAKKNGTEFLITAADLPLPQFCPLLGIELCYCNDKLQPNSPSIDRVDPTLGYIPGNVWIISHKANCVKNNLTSDELGRIARNLEQEIERRSHAKRA